MRVGRRAGGLEQLPGVREGSVGLLQAGQHPGQLALALGVVEDGQPRRGDRAVAGLVHDDVAVGERRHLRQVRHDQHLRVAGQLGQPPADLDGGLAADSGVDLVEDEDRHRAGLGERDLDGQHDPRELAAGGALVQWPGVGAGVGGQQELHLVDAAARWPAASGRRPGARWRVRPSLRSTSWPRTSTVTRACGIASSASSSVTTDPSRVAAFCRAAVSLPAAASSCWRRLVCSARSWSMLLVGGVEVEQPTRAGLGPGEHLVDRLAVLPRQRRSARPGAH